MISMLSECRLRHVSLPYQLFSSLDRLSVSWYQQTRKVCFLPNIQAFQKTCSCQKKGPLLWETNITQSLGTLYTVFCLFCFQHTIRWNSAYTIVELLTLNCKLQSNQSGQELKQKQDNHKTQTHSHTHTHTHTQTHTDTPNKHMGPPVFKYCFCHTTDENKSITCQWLNKNLKKSKCSNNP